MRRTRSACRARGAWFATAWLALPLGELVRPKPNGPQAPAKPAAAEEAPKTFDELEREARASGRWSESIRRGAVKKLAELGTPPAFELVLEALEDPVAMVADEAQLGLGQLSDVRRWQSLLGAAGLEHRDPLVRLRAAEAFGRSPIVQAGEPLARAAQRTREPELASTLLWSIERLALARRLGDAGAELAELLQHALARAAAPQVRAAALFALAALDRPRAAAELAGCLRSPDAELRSAALALWPEPLAPGLEPEVARLAGDAHVGVRAQAIAALRRSGERTAALVLVERLAIEVEPRLRATVLEALQEMSGLLHRYDPRPWRDWASALAPDWRASPPRAAREGEVHAASGLAGGSVAQLVGLPLLSRRLCILIDLSGSIWQTGRGERTRKQIVDEELARTLEALPPEVEFNLIPYANEPLPWSERLQPATPTNVRKALEHFHGIRQGGKGNVWSALELAFADARTDTIVLLSDGAPSGGARWNLELIEALLAHKNRTRRLAIDALLVDAPPGKTRPWQRIAAASGGRTHSIAL